jgi:hypothetical protein
LHKRIGVRPWLDAKQLRQLRNVGRNPPRFIAREQACRGSPAGLIVEIDGGAMAARPGKEVHEILANDG